jgi:hypothetical protein
VFVDVASFDVSVIGCVPLSSGESGGGGLLRPGDHLNLVPVESSRRFVRKWCRWARMSE